MEENLDYRFIHSVRDGEGLGSHAVWGLAYLRSHMNSATTCLRSRVCLFLVGPAVQS